LERGPETIELIALQNKALSFGEGWVRSTKKAGTFAPAFYKIVNIYLVNFFNA